MDTPKYEFDNVDTLIRNFDLEGRDGVELGLPNGAIFIVLAANEQNPMWKAQQESIRQELRRLSNANAPAEQIRNFLAEKYATCLVKDWRNVTIKGQAIPFSREACTAYLRQVHDVYTILDNFVYETKNFRSKRAEVLVDELGEIVSWDVERDGEVPMWLERAKKGDKHFIDRLLTRPALSTQAIPYYSAWQLLDRDREYEHHGLGMAADIRIPIRIPLPLVRAEGVRQGYDGDGLEDFELIISSVDSIWCVKMAERIIAKLKKDSERDASRRRNKME